MLTFEDFLRPVPAIDTGDRELDALLRRAEDADEDAVNALSSRPDAGAAVGARLEQLAAAIGPLARAQEAERSIYEAVWAAQQPRVRSVELVARAAAAHGDEDVLLRLFTTHPAPGVRLAVGHALLGREPSRAALEQMVTAMDIEDGHFVWVRDLGTKAAVRLDPATSYDRLLARFERELAQPHSYLARGLFTALHESAPIDDRWFPFLVRFYATAEGVVLDSVLTAHPVPAAVEALASFVRERVRAGEPWLTYAGFTFERWGAAGKAAAPVMIEAAEAALKAGKSDYQLTKPLDALVAMNDPSVVPALSALLPLAKRKAKTAVEEALKKLGAEVAPPKPKKSKKAAIPPERAHLAAILSEAGFSEHRVAELVKIAAPRVAIEPKEGSSGLGQSRLGGDPDLPAGASWPVVRVPKRSANDWLALGLAETPHAVDGKSVVVPLGFVAQLRLDELAAHDASGKLPERGLLSFFARQDVTPGDHGDLQRIAAAVIYTESVEDLEPLEPPPELPDHERRPPVAVGFRGELPLPEPPFAYALGLLNDESTLYDGLARPHPVYSVLGQAPAAYYRGLPGKRESVLLSVGSDAHYTWGDASSVFFLIPDAALRAADFGKAICVADEC